MFSKIKISALSYSNTFPFVFGLQHYFDGKIGELHYEVPALTAKRFKEQEVDIALVPVGSLQDIVGYEIITDYCIGSDGPVKTVALFTNSPLRMLKNIYIDPESRSSARLIKILAEHHWKIHPAWQPYRLGIRAESHEGLLLIGDKTFEASQHYRYSFDLSAEWKKMTGLPFVFAVWIARKHIQADLVDMLNEALSYGLDHLPEVYQHFDMEIPENEFLDYIQHYIDYRLDPQKRKAIERFLSYGIHAE